jgi:hypothetical protein
MENFNNDFWLNILIAAFIHLFIVYHLIRLAVKSGTEEIEASVKELRDMKSLLQQQVDQQRLSLINDLNGAKIIATERATGKVKYIEISDLSYFSSEFYRIDILRQE